METESSAGSGRRCIGLDVHREFAQVAVWQGGLVIQAGRFATTPEGVRTFAEELGPDDEVALEATGNTWAIATLPPRSSTGPKHCSVCTPSVTTPRLVRLTRTRSNAAVAFSVTRHPATRQSSDFLRWLHEQTKDGASKTAAHSYAGQPVQPPDR